jgi:hypothetical protein
MENDLKQDSKKYYALVGILAMVFSTGCIANEPSLENAKKIVENHYQKQGCVKVIDFKKLDGIATAVMGAPSYCMQIEFNLEPVLQCYGVYDKQTQSFGAISRKEGWQGPKLIKMGEIYPIKAKIVFQKEGSNWDTAKHHFTYRG